MLAVLMLFLLPVGGGIPAGVLLAKSQGQRWPVTAGLYFVSDVILALVFEPVLRGLLAWSRRRPRMAQVKAALKAAIARSAAPFGGTAAGPLALILVAFGVDPMTGRATAHAAGHGFLSGWALAITGDMLYYAVIAASTLKLNATLKNPTLTVGLVLVGMMVVPALVQRLRARWRRGEAPAELAEP